MYSHTLKRKLEELNENILILNIKKDGDLSTQSQKPSFLKIREVLKLSLLAYIIFLMIYHYSLLSIHLIITCSIRWLLLAFTNTFGRELFWEYIYNDVINLVKNFLSEDCYL